MTDEIGKLRCKIRELESDLVVAKETDPRRRERRRSQDRTERDKKRQRRPK
jgi:hypothetical protein